MVSAAGGSAAQHAAHLRAGAQRGLWRRLLAVLGFRTVSARTAAEAAAWDAGAAGEAWTGRLLAELQLHGWWVLHDRALPGADRANADHVVISPAARVFLVDSKLWSARANRTVHQVDGQLRHGPYDRSQSVRSVVFERTLVARALRLPESAVTALIAVHRAPVADGGFFVGDVPVVPADRLVTLLTANDGRRDPNAVLLAQAADRVLPPYR